MYFPLKIIPFAKNDLDSHVIHGFWAHPSPQRKLELDWPRHFAQLMSECLSIGCIQRRRSLDAESAATLVRAFVASRIDYCNADLACAPKATTNKLQRVLNAAARVVTGTKKFE